MKWTVTEPKSGDMIRTKVNFYYHYGIFADEDSVIQFGMPDNTGIDPDTIEVITTDVKTFSNGSIIETAILSASEKIKRYPPKKTVEIALSRVGEKGYNILHNNCEHFVNECVFGESKSTFLDNVRSVIQKRRKNK